MLFGMLRTGAKIHSKAYRRPRMYMSVSSNRYALWKLTNDRDRNLEFERMRLPA